MISGEPHWYMEAIKSQPYGGEMQLPKGIALDSGSKGPGIRPEQVIVLCSLAKHFVLSVPLSTQVL